MSICPLQPLEISRFACTPRTYTISSPSSSIIIFVSLPNVNRVRWFAIANISNNRRCNNAHLLFLCTCLQRFCCFFANGFFFILSLPSAYLDDARALSRLSFSYGFRLNSVLSKIVCRCRTVEPCNICTSIRNNKYTYAPHTHTHTLQPSSGEMAANVVCIKCNTRIIININFLTFSVRVCLYGLCKCDANICLCVCVCVGLSARLIPLFISFFF